IRHACGQRDNREPELPSSSASEDIGRTERSGSNASMSETRITSCPVPDVAADTVPRAVSIIAGGITAFASRVANEVERQQPDWIWHRLDFAEFERHSSLVTTSFIFIPPLLTSDGMTPDLMQSQRVFEHAGTHSSGHFILLSSALVYGTGANRQGLVREDCPPLRNENHVCDAWASLEALASEH